MDLDLTTLCFVAARAVQFFACLAILGLWTFDRFVIGSIDVGWPRIVRRWMLIALPAVLISGIVWFGCVAIAMSGQPANQALRPTILRLVWSQTYFGSVWKCRTIFLTCSALTTTGIFVARNTARIPAKFAWPGLAAGVLLVGSLAYSGHGQTGLAPGWHLLADIVHLLIAAVWPMGLLPFAIVLLRLRRPSADSQWADTARLTQRFSTISLIAVALIAVSGIVNAWCLLGSFNELVSTQYGQVLLLKISLFVLILIFAAINRLILKLRLLLGTHSPSQTCARLQINTAIEFALTILILILTGLLGTLPPTRM